MTRLAQGIVRDDVEYQIFRAVVNQLMRFARFEDEGIPGLDRGDTRLMPHPARPEITW